MPSAGAFSTSTDSAPPPLKLVGPVRPLFGSAALPFLRYAEDVGAMQETIRILAINRNRILLEGIRALIGMQPDLQLVGSGAGLDDALKLFIETRPDLTLMDLDLPANGGPNAIRRMLQIDPTAWIIGLITYEEDASAAEAMAEGASAVLAKDLIREVLVPVIRAGSRRAKQYEIPAAEELCGSERQ